MLRLLPWQGGGSGERKHRSDRLNSAGRTQIGERQVDGQPVFVVDGLFAPDLVQVLYEMLRKLEYSLSDYDTIETSTELHWKHEFTAESLQALPLFRTWCDTIVAKTEELFPARPVFLARVHCNNQPYGDLQRPHVDIPQGVTALYFANAEWQRDWQGELIFYDRNDEPLQAVAPRPGRVVIFPGDLLHRGGVPSRVCFQPRLSVAFKFASRQ